MKHEPKVRRVNHPRSAPSYLASSMKFPVSREAQYAVAYASPFAPFGGFGGSAVVPGGIPRFPGSTVSFRSSCKVLAGGSQSFALRLQAVRTPLLHFARWRMMLGSSAAVKDQPEFPQSSPRTALATCFASEASPRWIPCGDGKLFFRFNQSTPSGTIKPK